MKIETDKALRNAISVASKGNDLMMVAVLGFVHAICLMDGERELAEILSPIAHTFQADKDSFPPLIEIGQQL